MASCAFLNKSVPAADCHGLSAAVDPTRPLSPLPHTHTEATFTHQKKKFIYSLAGTNLRLAATLLVFYEKGFRAEQIGRFKVFDVDVSQVGIDFFGHFDVF